MSQFEAAKLRVTGAVVDLVAEVREAFYQVQADQQLGELLSQVIETTEAAADLAQRLHEAGNITRLEFDREQVFYEESRQTLIEAETRLALDRERLNVLLGLWGAQTQWTIALRLPAIPEQLPDDTGLEKQAIDASLILGALRQQIAGSARILGLHDATALFPTLEVGISAEREEAWDIGPTLSLPLPVFDQGQARHAVARSNLQRARQEYFAEAVEIRAVMRAARQAVTNASMRARHLEGVLLPLRARIVSETQLQYNAGQLGAFELLFAKQQQIHSAVQYILTLRGYWLARTRLAQLLSGGLPKRILANETAIEPAATLDTDTNVSAISE